MKTTKIQWGLQAPPALLRRMDVQAEKYGESRQEYARRHLTAAVERDEKKGGAK